MELLKRIISAIILIPAVIGTVIWGVLPTIVLAEVVCILMMIDVTSALKKGGFKPNRIVLVTTAALMLPAVLYQGTNGYFLLSAISFSIMAACVILSKRPDFKTLLSGAFALVYPLIPASLLVLLCTMDLSRNERFGMILVIGAIVCACFSDTFAYFFGKFFGKRKLCPQISPKKTIFGSFGSFVGGVFGGFISYLFLNMVADIIPVHHWLIMGFLCGGFSQIGDLTASMLKRFCDVKDFGNYIPGHGGIMDRMDSISTCLIAIVAYVQIFVEKLL